MEKEIDFQVHEAQRIPNKMNPKRSAPRYVIIKWQKLKIKREFEKKQEKSN